jgi:hypothetical protein
MGLPGKPGDSFGCGGSHRLRLGADGSTWETRDSFGHGGSYRLRLGADGSAWETRTPFGAVGASERCWNVAVVRKWRWFGEIRFGARSAAGSMTPLSLTPNVREHRFQMHHYRDCAGDPLSRGFEPLSFAYFSLRRQRKVGAAPHRGNANKPLRKQGKANTIRAQPKSAAQAKNLTSSGLHPATPPNA